MTVAQRQGFDNETYLSEQSAAILERVEQFGEKLYLEFGGKLLFDFHAARVLPGYDANVKIKLLKRLKDKIEIVFCVSAKDVAKGRIRGDFGMSKRFNLVHGSDSPESAEDELALFFEPDELVDYDLRMYPWIYDISTGEVI